MAEIRILPAASTPAELSRAYEALSRSFEAGHDLGDRGHHIRTIRAWLESTHQNLRRQIDSIRHLPSYPGIDLDALALHLDVWSQALMSAAAAIDQMNSSHDTPIEAQAIL